MVVHPWEPEHHMKKMVCCNFKVNITRFTVRVHIIKILLIFAVSFELLILLHQTNFDGTSLSADMSCEKMGLLSFVSHSSFDVEGINFLKTSFIQLVQFLFSGCPQYLLDKLQKVQNAAARLVCKAKKSDHIHPILETLHCIGYQ